MKKLMTLLCITFALCIPTSTFAWENGVIPVILNKATGPITGTQKPSRDPQGQILSVNVFYYESGYLAFCNTGGERVTFCIYNDQNELELQGLCVFDEEGQYTLSLLGLYNGVYTLFVTVDNVHYQGTFEIGN